MPLTLGAVRPGRIGRAPCPACVNSPRTPAGCGGSGRPANVKNVSDGLGELYQVSQAVLSVTRQMSVRDVLQVIVRSARSLVGARYAALGVPDEGNSFAEFVVDGISGAEWQAIGPLPRRHGMLGVLLNEGKPERLSDIRAAVRHEQGG